MEAKDAVDLVCCPPYEVLYLSSCYSHHRYEVVERHERGTACPVEEKGTKQAGVARETWRHVIPSSGRISYIPSK